MPLIRRHRVLALLFGTALLLPLSVPASAELAEKERDKIVEAATKYFDLGEDLWKGRMAFLKGLEELAKTKDGYNLLGDMESLRQVIYAARYFEPQMSDKKWQRAEEVREYDNKGRMYSIMADGLNITFSLPKKYPNKNKKFDKQPRPGPWPVVMSTIERSDTTLEDQPGYKLLKRRFPKKQWQDFLDEWLMLVPIAPGAVYVDPANGKLKREYMMWQFVQFLRHYHVDFDRIILDGKQEALIAASAQGLMFAGFVFRGGELDETLAKTVVNYSHVPTYVVKGQEKLAEALKKAGHENVTVGGEGPELAKWMKGCKRIAPTSFSWRPEGAQHQFAHWINLEQIGLGVPERMLKAEVDKETNTINIEAIAIPELSLFLNDDIVDLDKPVKVVINGHVEHEGEVKRSLDLLFNRDPFKLRGSMFFGLLFPSRIVGINVRAPVKKVEPEKPTTRAASPEDEAKAKKYFEGAVELIEKGNIPGALKRLEAVVKLGNTTFLERAKKLIDEHK